MSSSSSSSSSSEMTITSSQFEPDMLAFSGCYYGGGEKERKELDLRGMIRGQLETDFGVCIAVKDVHLYVASGEVYGGDETLAPLRALFPNIHSKDTIATKDELEPFSTFSSRMVALDFIVCDESDVFVTNNNGNMAKNLAGRRYVLLGFNILGNQFSYECAADWI
ncbi:GDP-fucose protein O-fucosyltransferase [Tanacetum coccineum]